MVEVARKDKESIPSLLRRFTRKTQQAGIMLQARRARYHRKPPSKYKQQQSAIRRERVRVLYQKLVKEGVIEEGKQIPQQLKKKAAG